MKPDQFDEAVALFADISRTEVERTALALVAGLSVGERIADSLDVIAGQLADLIDGRDSEREHGE